MPTTAEAGPLPSRTDAIPLHGDEFVLSYQYHISTRSSWGLGDLLRAATPPLNFPSTYGACRHVSMQVLGLPDGPPLSSEPVVQCGRARHLVNLVQGAGILTCSSIPTLLVSGRTHFFSSDSGCTVYLVWLKCSVLSSAILWCGSRFYIRFSFEVRAL
ncbi:uncharacterized protein LOC123397009 [Hordeum vulgare subsp. vulgare]|uniref:uncharacterized protein LOC123397009 n=1 Tax=Hordeum vulgare subsp. vulgare TaxID=112509 RepID=UPI000B487DAE|nr:uncharacterized protein LOC123397009 [Hordeum vulgare subsp. vulgare]